MQSEHIKAMQKGRRKRVRERAKEGNAKVKAWKRWLSEGSPSKRIPPVPTDEEWRRYEARAA